MNEGYLEHLFSLKGKVALITGAAHGIGFAVGLALGRAGACVCFTSRNPESIEKALEEYRKQGISACGYQADVTQEDQVKNLIDAVRREKGPVDILVNNAGIIVRKPMIETTAEEFRQVVDTDLVGPFLMSKAVLPDMIARRSGKIINLCSMMSEVGRENVSAYAAAKGGLKMLTRNICAEYGKENIQCNAIAPGYIATSQTEPLRRTQPDGTPHPFDRFIRSRTPAGRWGTIEDLEGAALFLASAASNFVNGQLLYVDGGILASLGNPES